MQTVYFPFTDVDAAKTERLHGWFGRFCVLVPIAASDDLERLDAGGTIRLVHPLPELDAPVTAAIEQARAWAADLNEKDLRYFRSGKGDIPFFSENSVAGIRSAIRSAASDKTAESDLKFFKAKVILGLAQLLDRQREELSEGLRHLKTAENELQRLLSDDADAALDKIHTVSLEFLPDPFAFKLMDRVQAWAELAVAAGETFAESNAVLLITDGFSIFNELTEILDKNGGCVQSIALPVEESQPKQEPFHEVLARSIVSTGDLTDINFPGGNSSENGIGPVMSLFRTGSGSLASLLRQLSGSSDTGLDSTSGCDVWIGHIRSWGGF